MPIAAPKAPAKTVEKLNGMSSDAVKRATGRTWPQWLKLLDAAGCAKMDHKQIVALVSKKYDVGPWWQQMVTVGYEQSRGRKKHQTADGFSISASKTMDAGADAIYTAWVNARHRAKWLDQAITVTTSTPRRSVRFKWHGDDTRGSVMLYPKGDARCQITIEHARLSSATSAGKMKKFWGARLGVLSQLLKARRVSG